MQSGDVKSNRTERTVLTYRKLEFRGEWQYHFGEYSFRPLEPKAELLVVTEGATGVLETHWFTVHRRPDPPGGGVFTTDNVIVPKEENIVFVPERCAKREAGDHTACR
ncbi:MAG: hypothetical protein KIT09_08895 [Bryobacteraceae bacterium]|nr:hypothetical protein [Bryobacteraceae bacterium]